MKKISWALKNLSIKGKVLVLSMVLVALIIILGSIGLLSVANIGGQYQNMVDTAVQRHIYSVKFSDMTNNLRANLNEMVVFNDYGHSDRVKESYETIQEQVKEFKSIAEEYHTNFSTDSGILPANRQKIQDGYDAMIKSLEEYNEQIEKLYEEIQDKDEEAIYDTTLEADEVSSQMQEAVAALLQLAVDREAAIKDNVEGNMQANVIFVIAFIIVVVVVAVILAIVLSEQIAKPIIKVAEASLQIANGNFDVDVRTNLTNEVGQLSNNFGRVIDEFNQIIEDSRKAFSDMVQGEIDTQIDAEKYVGIYREFIDEINYMLENTTGDMLTIINSVGEYSKGNFDFEVPKLPGKKVILNETLDSMKKQLRQINSIISEVISEINNGVFEIEINDDGFKGEWQGIIIKLRELITSVAKPIEDTKKALSEIAKANFDFKLDTTEYKGGFKEMAEDINHSADVLSIYIDEISNILTKMASQDLDVSIEHEYIGDFKIIKDSLELIIKNFNQLIEEIMLSSEQVTIGSNSIADSSTVLAQGASEQASAVEELTATIGTVAVNTSKNTELVIESSKLAEETQSSVETVKSEMHDLLSAMKEINESSSNISSILRVIDDIAFQTNILALNAAVEAARAGEQGKGFAIVAEEVRNLAARSSEAAKNTSELIEISIEKAEQGSVIADRTAETINNVTSQIEKISSISKDVAISSKEQNKSINEVNIGIKQISEVVSTNTATSEESAAASEELASQSAVFKEMVSKFNLKNKRNIG